MVIQILRASRGSDEHGASQTILPAEGGGPLLPAIITEAGPNAAERFIEFFTANIRNAHTRRAYARAALRFLGYCESRGVTALKDIRPVLVAAYIEERGKESQPQSVKQELAAVRMLFDFLVVGQVVPMNPSASVRGPKYSTKKGKTPVLARDDARRLLGSIPTTYIYNPSCYPVRLKASTVSRIFNSKPRGVTA